MRRPLVLLLLALLAFPLGADLTALRVLQSGSPYGSMAMHDRGVDGRGEIIAIVDTGADVDSCVFAEADGSLPPVNTGSAQGLGWQNVDLSRRKVIAYDFLYSCDQFPGRAGCDDPSSPRAWDNNGHGTIVASVAAGDRAPFGIAGDAEGIAPGAKLIIQDTGYVSTSACSVPGLGCPPSDLTPILDQAYRQGARIQSQEWGDRMGSYSQLSEQLDAFVASHPDFVLVFNAGNAGKAGAASVTGPGLAKNTIQAGGTREMNFDDSVVWEQSGRGPAAGGRIKPDLVVPSYIYGTWGNGRIDVPSCEGLYTAGTSWSAPLLAGSAALVRQYYREGFYPGGAARARDAIQPSAALVKATLIASARAVPEIVRNGARIAAGPVPSFEQGFGMPVLSNVLTFQGAAPRIRIADRPDGIAQGESFEMTIETAREGRLSATLVWTDPASAQLVHDLDLEMIGPANARAVGNAPLTGGAFDRANNVEKAELERASAGAWRVRVHGFRVGPGQRQPFALVVAGEIEAEAPRRRMVSR
ncbi:MAG TPA: S8 family serine peptidase [Thermoanaerobaculia bacterium]|nr:S8 family serine peptidase [Thermoanaerobaculia bacterium]